MCVTDRTRQQVAFHAVYLHSEAPPYGTPVIVNHVMYNHGNAYSGTTGYFTAPFPGVYFFAGTTGSDRSDHAAYHYLYVDNTPLSGVRTYEDHNPPSSATAHAAVHLTTGQRVWIRSYGDTYNSPYTTFSGFLISPDP